MSIRDTVTGVQHVGIPTTDLEGTIASTSVSASNASASIPTARTAAPSCA